MLKDLNPNRCQFNVIFGGHIACILHLGNGSMVHEGCSSLLTKNKQCSFRKEAQVDQRADGTLS